MGSSGGDVVAPGNCLCINDRVKRQIVSITFAATDRPLLSIRLLIRSKSSKLS